MAPTVSAAAGTPAAVPVRVVHRGKAPARIRVTIFGLDARWAPPPLDLGILQPGDSAAITLTILPERGSLGASYPFTIAAEASSAAAMSAAGAAGRARPVVGVAESTLVLDAAERVSMSLTPSTPSAVFSRGIRVNITNPSGAERTFTLAPNAAAGASLRLRRASVTIPAQQTVTVPGRVRVKKPTIFGGENTHTFTVSAQGTGAPEWVEGTLRSTPMFGKGLRTVVGLIAIVAVWAALAIVFIPKISDAVKSKNDVVSSTSTTSGGAGSGAAGANGGAAAGDGATGANGGAGADADGSAGASGGQPAGGYVVSGTVTGPGAAGASATLQPVSLASAGDDGTLPTVKPGPGASPKALRGSTSAFTNRVMPAADGTDDGAIGKIRGPVASVNRDGFRTTTLLTTDKGEFTFGGVTAPGYYLLTIGKAGFQTQRFLINSANLAAPQPMKVQLEPGAGKLSGSVTGPGGAIGAATIVVTDGTVTLQTSSISASTHTGTPGTWTLDQVSTPGTYLVTASAPGLGSASKLVTLDASGSAQVDLQLSAGQGSIVGKVSGEDSLGAVGGLGGITVTATGGDTTRTATTVTSAAMRGAFVLPNLPAPGTYTLTISGPGFLTQTRDVSLGASGGTVTVNATLSRADAVVAGMVTGIDANGKAEGGLGGVGLTLASNDVTMKTMTTSGSSAGSYQFTGVAPGSYVLTAVQFGRVTASATVELAASAVQTVDLELKADIGAELPATAHIRGQVADSRTGGPLTCDRALETVAAADCVATVTVTAPKDPADESKGTVTYTSTATAALNYVYTIPDLSDPSAGLPPGLYTVTVQAPGYEDTVTHVQVAQGQTMPAPVASMPPLGIISGTITTRVGTPAKDNPTCVLAVPTSVSLPALSTLPNHCAQSTDGNTCTVQGIPGAQPCAIASAGEAGQAPVGTYTIRGLTHGQYRMVLVAQDPEYVYTVGTVPTVTLELGADGQFNAALDRLGRIELSIKKLNPATGQLEPETGATITLKNSAGVDVTPHLLAGTPAGFPIITQLAADTYTITATATISAPGGGTTTVTATGTSAPTALNQSVSMTLLVANRSGAVIGRVISNVNNTPVAVPGALVSINGTVVSQSGASDAGYGSVTTDSNGCYAIVPDGWAPAKDSELTSPACPIAVPPSSKVIMQAAGINATLISDNVEVSVGPTVSTAAYPTTSATITDCPSTCGNDEVRIILNIAVTAKPLPVAATLGAVGPGGFALPDLALSPSPIRITTVSKPATAGTVTLSRTPSANWSAKSSLSCTDPTGNVVTYAGTECSRVALTFADSTAGNQNLAIPGQYQFSVSVDGFNPITIYLQCEFGKSLCVFVANPTGRFADGISLSVMQKPSLSVAISLPVTNGKYSTDAWDPASVQQTAGTSLGSVAVAADAPTYDTVDPATVTSINAHLTFAGEPTVLAPNPGNYAFAVSGVKGYNGTTAVGANCGSDFTDPCVASPPVLAAPYPTFDTDGSTVALDHSAFNGTDFDFSDITATVDPNSGGYITISMTQVMDPVTGLPALDTSGHVYGHVTWADSTPGLLADQTIPRSYLVTFKLPGFADSAPTTVDCTSGGACSTGAITLKRLPAASGTLTIPLALSATSVAIPASAITVTSPSGSTVSVTAPSTVSGVAGSTVTANLTWHDSTVGIDGLIGANNYTVSIAIDGYKPAQLYCDVTTADSCVSDATLELNPQPTMKLTILPANDTNTVPIVSVDSGKSNAKVTSDLQGNLTWKQKGADGIVSTQTDPYTLVATLSGYEMSVGGQAVSYVDFYCTSTSNCTFPQIVLTKKTDLAVKLVVDGSGTPVTANARISLNGTSSPITTTGSATFVGRSTTGATETGGVWSDGTYTLDVQAAGYKFVTDLSAAASSVTCTNGSTTLTGLKLVPGGTTTCTVKLTALGAITGTTVWDAVPLTGSTAPAVTPLTGVTLTATKGAVSVTATSASGTDSNGFTLTGQVTSTMTDDVEGLIAGEWTIAASPVGYQPISGTFTISCADNAADTDGFCDAGYKVSAVSPGTASSTSSYLKLDNGVATIHFVPVPVKVTVEFVNGGVVAPLPSGNVTFTSDVGGSWTCTTPTAATSDECTISSDAKSLSFADVPPGNYTLDATFSDGKYSSIVGRAVTVSVGADHTESLPVTARINTVTGFVKDSAGTVIPGANVKLCNSTDCPAPDYDGSTTSMTATTVTSGTDTGKFTFGNVADGIYHFVVTKAGYVTNTTGNFTVNFDNGSVPIQNVTLVAPTRQTLSMTFTAPAGLTLTGATVKLSQTDYDGRITPSEPVVLTASNISGAGTDSSPYTSTLLQVPTGTYTVSVSMGSSTVAPFPFPAGSVTVTAGPDTQNETLAVGAATVTVMAKWTDAVLGCVPAPTAAIPLQIKIGTTGTLTSIGSTNVPSSGATTADRVVFLPTGTYYVQSNLTGWQTPSDAEVQVASAPGTASGTVVITPVTTSFDLKIKTDGNTSSNVNATATASCAPATGGTYTKNVTLKSASGAIVLPGASTSGWTFTLNGTVDGVTASDLTGVLSGTTVTFAVVTPTTASATVTVNQSDGTTPATGATVKATPTAGGSASDCTATSTPGGFTCAGLAPNTGFDIKATWTNGGVDYAGSVTVTTGKVGSVKNAGTITLTAAPTTASATVEVTGPGAQMNIDGASVSVKTQGATRTEVCTGTTVSGAVTCMGLTPNTTFDVSASWTDTTASPNITYSGSGTLTTDGAGTSTAKATIPLT